MKIQFNLVQFQNKITVDDANLTKLHNTNCSGAYTTLVQNPYSDLQTECNFITNQINE